MTTSAEPVGEPVHIEGVSKRFGSTPVLADVDLVAPGGAITAVLGASGSGKTTLLRIVAGIEAADTGRVRIGSTVVDDGARQVAPQRRRVGYVPQDGALFPHLTVAGNVGFGLPRSGRGRVAELVDLAGLGGLERRFPHQLSGGQQQRVALVRALAIAPAVVLLDEPFSSLDAALRASLRDEVARLVTATGTTTIMVTHDRDEALSLAEQVVVLDGGRVAAAGAPRALYAEPPGPAEAAWVGEANLIDAVAIGGRARSALGEVDLCGTVPDGPVHLLLRPEQIVLTPLAEEATGAAVGVTGSGVVAVSGVVEAWRFHGHEALATVRIGPDALTARVPGGLVLGRGDEVVVSVCGPARAWPVEGAGRPRTGPDGADGVPGPVWDDGAVTGA